MKRTTLAVAALCATALLTGCSDGKTDDSGSSSESRESTASSDSSASADAEDGGSTDAGELADLTGEEIAAASKEAMGKLTSLRVAGELNTGTGSVAVDLSIATGNTCTGTLTLADADVEILGVDGTIWAKPSPEFWRAQIDGEQAEQVITAAGDKWVLFPQGQSGFEDFCDLEAVVGEDADEETYETGEVSDVDGTTAIAVTSTDADGAVSTGYVQVEGEHYLLKVERPADDAGEGGALTYSEFDEDVDAEAPAADDVFDISTLG